VNRDDARAPSPHETAAPRERIDKWLWRARFAKTRPLAAKLVSSGHVRVEGRRIDDPGRKIRVGDVLTVALPRDVAVVRVLDFGERRGPAQEARALYERVAPPEPEQSD
jgi:ribosome-associated heat shock protein Hsp15